jgi:hypothetical protein
MADPRNLVQGDRPTLEHTFTDQDGVAIDGTGGSAVLRYRLNGDAWKEIAATEVEITECQWEAELPAAAVAGGLGLYTYGELEWEWTFTDSSGRSFTSEEVYREPVRKFGGTVS